MSKGICVEKIGSIQIFQKEDGTYDGYDFATGKFIPDPYHDKPKGYAPVRIVKAPEQIAQEIQEISEYATHALPERALRKEYLEYFGVKIGVSEEDGFTPHTHYYPYTKDGNRVGYKVRLIEDKRMWSVGNQKDVDLFGWDQAIRAGGKKLFITEGECDAVALFQIFKDHNKGTAYADLCPAIVSLAHGSGGAAKELGKAIKDIRQVFKEIILVFDMDAAGKKAAEEVLRIIPDALVATLPAKDANACLIEGRSKACYNACQFNAQKPKNTRLVQGATLHEAAKERPEMGFSWPWKHLTKSTRGIRFGETVYIGAAQKMGKSDVVNTLAAHFIKEHNWKVFLVKPEEENKRTYKMVAGKLVGKFFHDPDKEFDDEAFNQAGEIISDKLYLLNLYQEVNWEVVKADIREAVLMGCKAVIIDPLTNMANGIAAADANVLLQKIAQEAAALALDLNIVMILTCHLRNPESGLPHERGGEVLSSQFAGSRGMARSCHLMIGLEGNRDPNLTKEERNMRKLVTLEDRNWGENGKFGLYWNHANGLFSEI